MKHEPLLEVTGLAKEFAVKGMKNTVKAVDGISFSLNTLTSDQHFSHMYSLANS